MALEKNNFRDYSQNPLQWFYIPKWGCDFTEKVIHHEKVNWRAILTFCKTNYKQVDLAASKLTARCSMQLQKHWLLFEYCVNIIQKKIFLQKILSLGIHINVN